jgi:hypothetical protein
VARKFGVKVIGRAAAGDGCDICRGDELEKKEKK